jgi:hypothetical protein
MKTILLLIALFSFNARSNERINFHRIIDFLQETTEEKASPSGFCSFASPTFTTQKKINSFLFTFWSDYYNFTINYKCENKTLYKIECNVRVRQNDVNNADVEISDCVLKSREKNYNKLYSFEGYKWKISEKIQQIPHEIINYLNVETKNIKPKNSNLKLENLNKNFIDIDYELGS